MPRVDNKGISIHYRVEGDGPPLVVLHGITNSSETWYERSYVAALTPTYRLILMDARGTGKATSHTIANRMRLKRWHQTLSPSSTMLA